VTVLNRFTTSSNHRLIGANIEISTNVERRKMVKKKTKSWIHPADDTVFRQFLDGKMGNMSAPSDMNELNDKIVNTIRQAKNKFCPKNEKEQRMSPETKIKMEERRNMASD
ncbi:hypothetical protein HHI36_009069, partial [Cryptolaemus montrouzieri]